MLYDLCLVFPLLVNSISAEAKTAECQSRGEGKLVGQLTTRHRGVEGTVYAVDVSTLFINNFSYDGAAPDAFFWVGSDPAPSQYGQIVPYPEGVQRKLTRYDGSAVLLHLPNGMKLDDIKWLAVWCRNSSLSLGDVIIPEDLIPPSPRVIGKFKQLAHQLKSGNITILDGKTFYIPRLYYDGKGPNAFFIVGSGMEPNGAGVKVPDEVGSLKVLRRYSGQDITIQLPGHLTACDIDWLAVYCIKRRHNFGHVFIPKDLHVPPALGQRINPRKSSSSTFSKKQCVSTFLIPLHFFYFRFYNIVCASAPVHLW